MKLFQKGIDEETFTKLVNEYEQNVYNIALYTVQNEPLAQDITQDVFIKIYKKIGNYRGDAKLSTWIYRITKNTCYNHLKKEKKYKEMDELPESISDQATPEKELIYENERMLVRNAVGTLPEIQRMAISLFYFHDQSYLEIANIMNLPMNTLKSHIRRAKQSLIKILKP